jgi:hypothetical protein
MASIGNSTAGIVQMDYLPMVALTYASAYSLE